MELKQVNKKEEKKPTRIQIAFDLDTKVCREIMGNKYNHIYDVIRKNMENVGFSHQQGSVYISNEPLRYIEIRNIIADLLDKYPCLSKCVRDITQTEVGQRVSMNRFFNYDGTAGKFKRFDIDKQKKNVKGR